MLDKSIRSWLESLRFYWFRWRIFLYPQSEFDLSMLRGVWGKAIQLIDRDVYNETFVGTGPEFLHRAWQVASAFGLGKNRYPFQMERFDMTAEVERERTLLSFLNAGVEVQWRRPSLLIFRAPLRLFRYKAIICTPTLSDIMENLIFHLSLICRQLLHDDAPIPTGARPQDFLPVWSPIALIRASQTESHPWRGTVESVYRYSSWQRKEIELRGVTGSLDLPAGVGMLSPLLATCQIYHVGKSTTFGLGRLVRHDLIQ